MKKLVLSLMAAVALMFVPQTLAAVNFVQYLATYGNSLTIDTDTLGGVTYSTVRYGDLYNGGEPGMPSLPIDYIRFSVPYNATNFTVTASPSRWSFSNLSYLLYPCQMPWIPNDSIARPITLPDTAAYYSGVSYPSQMAWVVDEGFLAGENHIVTVAVMPFRYTHTTTSDEVRKCRNLTVRLNYELSDSLAMYPIVRNDSALREEGYQLAQSMVVNPNQVKSFSFSYSNPGVDLTDPIIINGGTGGNMVNGGGIVIDPPFIDIDTIHTNVGGEQFVNGDYPYLIITTPELYHATRRIAAIKRQKGYDVLILTLNQIYNHPISKNGYVEKDWNGNDTLWNTTNAGKIRQFLKFAYQFYNTKYVLLVGTDVPYTYFSPIPTDFYYCEFNSNYYQHKYEHYPEIYIGRILATSPTQINNYSDKLLRYELNPGNGDYSYLKRAFFNELGEFKDDLAGVISTLSNIYPNPTLVQEDTDHDYPKGSDIINNVNSNKYGFWGTFTHGSPTSIRTFGKENSDHMYFVYASETAASGDPIGNGLNNLTNTDFPMIFYVPNCWTIKYSSPVSTFGETFTTGKDFGGPVYMGSTYSISESSSKQLFEKFCEWIRKGEYKLGVADAKSKFYVDDEDSRIHNYLGDPSLELWTDIPQLYSGISITRTDSSMTISNLAVPSTVLTYYSTNKKLRTRIVSPQSITIEANPNYPVLLYKHNYIPYILPLFLQNVHISNDQYVIANEVRAGYAVDSGRTRGVVTIKNGTQYEIEASGVVQLEGGFIVEPGAMFAVYPSSF